jgi:TatD DNase family protein
MSVRFVDSHLHLERGDSETLASALATDLLLVTCGVDYETSSFGAMVARKYPGTVRAFVGVHPSEAEKEGALDRVEGLLENATGVGEVGLDPKYSDTGQGGAQMRAFLAQLEAAQRSEKPVQVHSRGAEEQSLDVISGYRLKSVLMHWFQSEEALPRALESGCFVSFGPALLYSKKLQRMALRCDPGRVLVESDSPVSYGPLGGVHGPSLVPSVIFMLGELWRVSFEEARSAVTLNAERYLGPLEKG